jgi:hypothetical protein
MSASGAASTSGRQSGFLLDVWIPCTPPISRMQGERRRALGRAESKPQPPLKRQRHVCQQVILKCRGDRGDAHRYLWRSKSTWHRSGHQIKKIDEVRVQSQTGVQTERLGFNSIDAVDWEPSAPSGSRCDPTPAGSAHAGVAVDQRCETYPPRNRWRRQR